MSDEGFHEIQLGGKQLIFLFMTAALVLVVAFLSGVLVGRGVKVEKDAAVALDASVGQPSAAADPSPAPAPSADTQQPAAPPVTAIAPPTPAEEELSYDRRLEDAKPPAETLKPNAEPKPTTATAPPVADAAKGSGPRAAAAPPPPAPKPAAPAAPAATKGKADAALASEPAGDGYYLKIVAYRDRAQADGVAKRLAAKGYSTYVVPLSGQGPVLYSVRVGKYKTRREADVARRRLEKEEQFKPLISH